MPLERRKAPPDRLERLLLDLPFGRLAGFAAGPADGPPVLIVHGWNARADFLLPLLSACARQNLRAYAFDMPAHGATREANPAKPTSTMVEWVETLIAATAALGVARWKGVIAHSFGALASCFALAPRPWPGEAAMAADSLVLIAAAAGMPTVIESYRSQVEVSAEALADIVAGVEGVTATPLAGLTIRAVANALPQRLLVVHDPADTMTRLADIRAELAAHATREELLRDGAGHDAILFQPDTLRAAARFVSG